VENKQGHVHLCGDDHAVIGLVGLARRSGKVFFGKEGIRKCLRETPAKKKLLLMSNDISESAKQDWISRAAHANALLLQLAQTNKWQLGKALGLQELSAVGISEDSLVLAILKKEGIGSSVRLPATGKGS